MGRYATDWCRAVVLDWEKKNPRVLFMIQRWTDWISVLKIENPREFIIKRLIFHLSRAKTSNVWRLIKLFSDKEIQWKYLLTEYILTDQYRPSMKGATQIPLLPAKESEVSDFSPIDFDLSTSYNEARAD